MCLRQYTEDACKYLRDTNRVIIITFRSLCGCEFHERFKIQVTEEIQDS